jgi:hypothetical protein
MDEWCESSYISRTGLRLAKPAKKGKPGTNAMADNGYEELDRANPILASPRILPGLRLGGAGCLTEDWPVLHLPTGPAKLSTVVTIRQTRELAPTCGGLRKSSLASSPG